jgi:hypothetical protein
MASVVNEARMLPISKSWMYRLREGGVACDANGLRVGGAPLLTRSVDPRGKTNWQPLPLHEIDKSLCRVYGVELSARGKGGGLRVVADALNQGEVARAQIAALLLRLPDPALGKADAPDPIDLVSRLRESGLLAKDWTADDHPRTGTPPNPGWFAPRDDGAGAVELRGGTTSGHETRAQSSAGTADDHEVAVLTNNFKYACSALNLDPTEATKILHIVKRENGLSPSDDCWFDTQTGDVIFNDDVIGNLKD